MVLNYDSVNTITELLNEKKIALKKRWGQNFLINRGAREKLVSYLDIQPGELVWEIGPGLGAMTALILEKQANVIAFEIDRGMIACLQAAFPAADTLSLIQGDIVKTWPLVVQQRGVPVKILGNLPYASASAIIASFVEGGLLPVKMIFTVQKELALRITALPGNKNYSSFTVFCQFAFKVNYMGELKPGSFFPVPDVVSAIVELVPAEHKALPLDRELFFRVVRCAFHARRKTLRNNLLNSNLTAVYPKALLCAALESEGLADAVRGETLGTTDFICLADKIKKLSGGLS